MTRSPFVILGAGFSRAIAQPMPLLADLSRDVMKRLGRSLDELRPFAGDLEQWLSYLAQDQPWLTDSDNFRNRALFREVAETVAVTIDEAETIALQSPMPVWLSRTIWEWSDTEASIVTFNYDTLLELATSTNGLVTNWADIYGTPLAPRSAPGDHYMFAAEGPRGRLFTLFKLHGSTNWRFGGLEAPTADRIVLTRQGGTWPRPPVEALQQSSAADVSPTPGRRRFIYADLEAMIVPPTGTKATYYGNRSIRAQWRTAFRTLEASDHLIIVGYSFPQTDQVIRGFMSTVDFGGVVTVVDYRPEAAEVAQRMFPRADIRSFDGPNAVPTFVDANAGHVVRWGARYFEGRYVPIIDIDGTAVRQLAEPPPVTTYDEALTAARAEVNRRWPELQSRTDNGHHVGSDNGAMQIAYIRARGSGGTVAPATK